MMWRWFPWPTAPPRDLTRIAELLSDLGRKVRIMAGEQRALTDAVDALTAEVETVVTALDALEAALEAATDTQDMAAVVAATAQVTKLRDRLALARQDGPTPQA